MGSIFARADEVHSCRRPARRQGAGERPGLLGRDVEVRRGCGRRPGGRQGILVIVCLGLLLGASVAGAHGSGGARLLASVKVEGGAFVQLSSEEGTWLNPDGCGNSQVVFLKPSIGGYNQMFALAMSAYVSGQRVGVYLDGCSSTPWGYTVPIVKSIWFSN